METKEKLMEDCKKCIQSYRERINLWDEIIPILDWWKTKDGKHKKVDKRLVDYLNTLGYKCTITTRTYKELNIGSIIYTLNKYGTDWLPYRSFPANSIQDTIYSINQDRERLVNEIKKMWAIIDNYDSIEGKVAEVSEMLDYLSNYKSEAVARIVSGEWGYLISRIF